MDQPRRMPARNATGVSRCWFAASALALVIAGCGSIRVSGVVADSDTGKPVVPCTITSGRYSSETSPSGAYNIKLPGSAKVLEYRAPGFVAKSVTLNRRFHSSRHVQRNVAMDRDPSSSPAETRFDPYTGKPLVPRFDPYTGEPLKQ